jgi:phosphoribosylformylglycinamidine synthase
MAGLIDEAESRRTQWFEAEGDRIALLGPEAVSLGGSEYLWMIRGKMAGLLAPLDLQQERRVHEACRAAIAAGLVRGAHDCAEGGLAVTLAECSVSGPKPIGARVELEDDGRRADLVLFGEGPSRVVVSVPPECLRHFERLMGEFALPWRWIGRVGGEALVVTRGGVAAIAAPLDRMADAWRAGFERHVA